MRRLPEPRAALAVLLSIPGTAWQSDCAGVALYGIVACDFALASLIPAGHTDGDMLYHLIRWTPPGQLLVANVTAWLVEKTAR
jgi:Zn-dependent protease